MRPRTRLPRAGKTLIELLVVIVTASTVLTIAGQLLFRVSRTERVARDAGTISRAELRLTRQLRADVRAATSAEAVNKDRLHLTLANRDIDYRATEEGIERRTGTARELYRLGNGESNFSSDGRFVTLNIEPQPQTPGFAKAAAETFRIVAATGADVRSDDSRGVGALSGTEPVEAPLPGRGEL